jgi:hypothetical protein
MHTAHQHVTQKREPPQLQIAGRLPVKLPVPIHRGGSGLRREHSAKPGRKGWATMKARIFAILGAATLAVGVVAGSGQAAYAQDPQIQYCDGGGYCLNAWNEGPYVDAYAKNHVNNNFYVRPNGAGPNATIEYTGPGGFEGMCIGDYGNTSGDARAALEPCSGSVPWGGNFMVEICDAGKFSGYSFYNTHWKGYLTPNADSNGSPFYLNSATPTCYQSAAAG